MTLPEGVVLLNRMMENSAVQQDYTTLEKLAFVRKQIVNHMCAKKKIKK